MDDGAVGGMSPPSACRIHAAIVWLQYKARTGFDARAAYRRARGTGARGVSLATIGLADVAMYQGKFDEAIAILPGGIDADEATKNAAGAGAKAIAQAQAHQARGETSAALASIQRARTLVQDPSALVPAAQLLLDTGRDAEAAKIAAQLDGGLTPRARAYGRMVNAMILLKRGRVPEAVDALQEAQRFGDLWLVRFYKGMAYVAAGANAEALSEFTLCEKRRGEATAVFLDDVPSYRYTVPLDYWLGRTHDALGSKEAAARYLRAYLSLRSPASDPLARDAERRVAGR